MQGHAEHAHLRGHIEPVADVEHSAPALAVQIVVEAPHLAGLLGHKPVAAAGLQHHRGRQGKADIGEDSDQRGIRADLRAGRSVAAQVGGSLVQAKGGRWFAGLLRDTGVISGLRGLPRVIRDRGLGPGSGLLGDDDGLSASEREQGQ